MRTALDWETVTPLDDLPASSLSDRVKKGLRWWRHEQKAEVRQMRVAPSRPADHSTGHRSWLAGRSSGAMSPGSVLFHAPSHVFQAPGGGENQLVQTGRHLEELGMTVRLFSPWTDRLDEARLLHLFGMSREGLELARVARAAGVPVVLSPICWFEPRAIAALAAGPARRAFDLAKWGLKVARLALAELAPRLAHRWPTPSCPTRRPRPGSSSGSSALDPRAIRVVPNGVRPEFAARLAGRRSARDTGREISSSTSAGSSRGRMCWG